MDGYAVEGHGPMAHVERLPAGRPTISGILLPSMPAESSGWDGERTELFTVHEFGNSDQKVFAHEQRGGELPWNQPMEGENMLKISKLAHVSILGAALVAGVAGASAESATSPSTPSEKGMMDHGTMQGGGMMPMMQEMSKMMENCNKMMQTMMDRQNQGGSGQQSPDKRG